MHLTQKANAINSREDLVDLVISLRENLINHGDSWENPTLESYLQAIAAWIRDMEGYYKNQNQAIPEHPDWKIIGQILLAAKYYE